MSKDDESAIAEVYGGMYGMFAGSLYWKGDELWARGGIFADFPIGEELRGDFEACGLLPPKPA